MSTELNEEGLITDEQSEIYNRQVCEMVSVFFKEFAALTPEQIYDAGSGDNDTKESILLPLINRAYNKFIENGEGLPTVYFDSYKRTVDQFVHVFKSNIDLKLEVNQNRVLYQVIGKEEITYTDIANAVIKEPEEEKIEEETATEVAAE